jgi:hypothetical protein
MQSTLADLPPDLWHHILDEEISYLVIPLWNIGNKRLQRQLAHGITSVSLMDSTIGSTSRFPRLLSQISSLRSLVIDRSLQSLGPAEILAQDLQTLTSRLEKLELRCAEAEECLLKPIDFELHRLLDGEDFFSGLSLDAVEPDSEQFQGNKDPNALKSHSSIEPLKGIHSPRGPRLWDIGAKFPCLESLILADSAGHLTTEDFFDLPRTLKVFRVGSFFTQTLGSATIKGLPEGLLDFGLSSQLTISDEDVANLPPNLTRLSGSCCPIPNSLKALASLPRSLTYMQYIPSRASLEAIEALPRGLEYFCSTDDVTSFSGASLLSKLPTTLTDISCFSMRAMVLNSSTQSLLPRSLTKIRAFSIDLTSCNPLSWPPEIKHMEFKDDMNPALCPWSNLPSTLDFLALKLTIATAPLSFLGMPNTLKTLNVWARSREYTIGVTDLPASLRITRISGFRISRDCISLLPSKLVNIRIQSDSKLTDSDVAYMPRTLQTLSLLREGKLTPECFGFLPRNLHTFAASISGDITGAHTTALPDKLQVLTLNSGTQRFVDEEAVAGLPRKLEFLDIRQLDGAFFSSLPPKLSSLRITMEGNITDNHLSQLPMSLHHLFLGNHACTAKGVENFPPNLKSYNSRKSKDPLTKAFESKFSREFEIDTPDIRVRQRIAREMSQQQQR